MGFRIAEVVDLFAGQAGFRIVRVFNLFASQENFWIYSFAKLADFYIAGVADLLPVKYWVVDLLTGQANLRIMKCPITSELSVWFMTFMNILKY